MKVRIQNLELFLGEKHILKNLSFSADGFESLAILGPSGSGKTSLFRVLAGLVEPQAGSLMMNGVEIPFEKKALIEYRKRIGVVFQNLNLFPHLTALENILLPLTHVHHIPRPEAKKRAFILLERFQLAEHANHYPYELSGGQRQRIAIVRALSHEPDLLLFDEPTSALDPQMTMEVVSIIEEIRRENRSFILVTHNVGFARRVADQSMFLADGEVLAIGKTSELLANSPHPRIQDFLHQVLLD